MAERVGLGAAVRKGRRVRNSIPLRSAARALRALACSSSSSAQFQTRIRTNPLQTHCMNTCHRMRPAAPGWAPLVVEAARQTETGCEGTVDGCLPPARPVPRPSPSSKAAIWLGEQMQRSCAAFAQQATCTLSTSKRPSICRTAVCFMSGAGQQHPSVPTGECWCRAPASVVLRPACGRLRAETPCFRLIFKKRPTY